MSSEARRPLSRRLAFGAALLVLVALATEGISFALGRIVLRDAPAATRDPEAPAPDLKAGRERAGLGFQDPAMSLHPFLGYVYTPPRPGADGPPPGISISADGFLDDRPAVRKRAEGRLVIGILGGSVAGQLGSFHLAHLEDALAAIEGFRGKELDFVRLGMPGYHQPQQVIQVASILAQGGEFDVLINLDGFNEVAVPAALNAPQGAHPLFPMNWSMVALDAPDPRVRRALGAIAYLKEERGERAARFRTSPFAHTATGKLVWGLADRRLARTAARFAWELQQFAPDSIPYFVRGPERDHVPTEELVPWCVDVWRRSSLELQALCDAHGIRYVHVLQPNQYLPGSKPLSSTERENAFDAESPYRAVVEQGYPLMQAAGRELRKAGVSFHDLSRVFDESDKTLYVDNCCHFNGEGNRILCESIAASLAAGG
ncbi:hypothetical protein K8I85_09760 [bacterium]|nr:hypothetical protein [bacterium]